MESFARECHTRVGLGLYAHVVTSVHVGVLGGVPCVFAEYVGDGWRKQWVDSGRLCGGGPDVALKRMLSAAIQFAWALHYAHARRLRHQEAKPANMLLAADAVSKAHRSARRIPDIPKGAALANRRQQACTTPGKRIGGRSRKMVIGSVGSEEPVPTKRELTEVSAVFRRRGMTVTLWRPDMTRVDT